MGCREALPAPDAWSKIRPRRFHRRFFMENAFIPCDEPENRCALAAMPIGFPETAASAKTGARARSGSSRIPTARLREREKRREGERGERGENRREESSRILRDQRRGFDWRLSQRPERRCHSGAHPPARLERNDRQPARSPTLPPTARSASNAAPRLESRSSIPGTFSSSGPRVSRCGACGR